MQESFLKIMDNYLVEKTKPLPGSDFAHYVRHIPKASIEKTTLIDTSYYKIEGSPGRRKNWAEIPWVAIFDKKITTGASEGYYIVYLFRADMSGFYLSLNQGWTYYKEEYGIKEGRENIVTVANEFRKLLNPSSMDFPLEKIDLKSKKNLAVGYQLGHICGKFYSKDDLPNDKQLTSDLIKLVGIYRELTGRVGSFERFADRILTTDIDDIEDEEYQSEVIYAKASSTPKRPQKKPKSTTSHGKEVWTRDPKVAKESLENSNYLCEIDIGHKTFTSSKTDENFVEAHHLIPMGKQGEFNWSLDVPSNIVSLCPNCHRRLHHATIDEKKDSLKVLYDKRKDDLLECLIGVSWEEILGHY
ncbi:DUF3578 domain-containing protein [Methanococcoides orientis]|uniref:DUF3578 domain-containing protein n=1 Tax=Methanococcoides orientis TaxID=2822137 RepID=UPI001E47D18A|nr:DUF3578 domain-containing protein [Methanococcoides orientis]UGV41482.1 DUF3578 domain-containing protein [Methanococcoides orientis]